MVPSLVLTATAEGVAVLTLNNPPLNLVTLEMTRQLRQRLEELGEDLAVRVLIVTGAGTRAFCAGSDIHEFPGLVASGEVVSVKLGPENEAYSQLARFSKPTIAALDGLAYGGGLELAVCCDLVMAAASVKLALPEINLGVFPGSGGTVRVTRRIGDARAKELMYFGDPIAAETALAWGLVDRVVPDGQALTTARELARRLAGQPNRALQLCKRAVRLGFEANEEDAVRQTLALSDEAFRTQDCQEGVRAFFAKEPPRFRHR
jgi:enoyl-CoA hydratase